MKGRRMEDRFSMHTGTWVKREFDVFPGSLPASDTLIFRHTL
jgi:hypothetical protein